MARHLLTLCLLFSIRAFAATEREGAVSVPTIEIAAGVYMPVMSIGTGGLERAKAPEIVTNWLSLGGRGIDTAWIYKNQEQVRAAIASAGVPREELFVTTKIPGCNTTREFVEDDLKQLGMQYIDLMLIHFPRPSSACATAWGVLEDYHAKGIIKSIGVSNFKKTDLQLLMTTAKVKPAVNQIELNVLTRDEDTLATCASLNISVEAYSPIGRAGHSGDISGSEVIKAVAANHNVSPYQVALKWILQHGHTITFQSASAAHQQADADVFGFNLTIEELAKLDGLGSADDVVELLV
jgi:2,5-diketo-D-gluconate reductase A